LLLSESAHDDGGMDESEVVDHDDGVDDDLHDAVVDEYDMNERSANAT
jgi:hypothetical protein